MPLEQPQLLVPKELAFPEEAKLPDAMSQWSLDAGVRLSAWSGLRGKSGQRHCPCHNSSLGAESSAHIVAKGASNTVPGRTVRTSIAWTYHLVGAG